MNSILENIHTRRSVRRYQPQQITPDECAAIVEAGRRAPSGGNNQTTRFLVIQKPEALSGLRELVESELAKMEYDESMYKSLKGSIMAAKKGGYDFCFSAPTLVVVSNKKGYGNAMADCACALENMMLAAHSLGVGSCWINQLRWLDDNEALHRHLVSLGLGEDETVCGSLALGYSAMEKPTEIKVTGNPVVYVL